MNFLIGNRIKELRKERGMTQEQLADLVGISFQAISKWENNIALPDITLVPKLAQIFGVSTDDLFSFHLREMQKEIEEYADRAYRFRESDPGEGRRILEEGLQKYPDNDILLNNLLYVLEDSDECIQVASRLIDKTAMLDIRYDALRFLAYAYDKKGDKDAAVAALEQIPEIYFTKLSELAFVVSGRPKYEAAEKQKWISFEILLQMMQKIAEYYRSEDKIGQAIGELERAIALITALEGEEKISLYSKYITFFQGEIDQMKELRRIQKRSL